MPGDRPNVEDWIDEHYRALYRHALWMTGNIDLASDLVQETYYQAWKARHTLNDEGKVFAWLLTILRRRVFEEYGRTARWNEYVATGITSAAQETYGEDVGSLLDLERALDTLSMAQRDILLLHVLQGLNYEQIAEHLNVPIGTVMSRLARARAVISRAMRSADAASPKVIPFGIPKKRKDSTSDG